MEFRRGAEGGHTELGFQIMNKRVPEMRERACIYSISSSIPICGMPSSKNSSVVCLNPSFS